MLIVSIQEKKTSKIFFKIFLKNQNFFLDFIGKVLPLSVFTGVHFSKTVKVIFFSHRFSLNPLVLDFLK
jgi:hypothetical protein